MPETVFTKQKTLEAKGLAILLLLSYHLFENRQMLEELQVKHAPFTTDRFLLFTGFGNICVAVFVFLTAYGISIGLLRQNAPFMEQLRQAWKRFYKLMLQFFILYLSVNLLWHRHFDYVSLYGSGKQGLLYALTDGLGLSMFFHTPTLNMTWWYMEIAYILIFLVPVLALLVQKTGYYLLPLAFFAPYVFPMGEDIHRYFFVAVLGVCAAYGHLPDKLLSIKIPAILKWIGALALLFLCVLIRQNYVVYETYVYLADAPIALLVIYVACALFGTVPGLKQALSFIGKHSMNIFLVHTFFYMSLWREYIYHFHYWLVSLLLCLLASLMYSVILEAVKAGVLRLFLWGKPRLSAHFDRR